MRLVLGEQTTIKVRAVFPSSLMQGRAWGTGYPESSPLRVTVAGSGFRGKSENGLKYLDACIAIWAVDHVVHERAATYSAQTLDSDFGQRPSCIQIEHLYNHVEGL